MKKLRISIGAWTVLLIVLVLTNLLHLDFSSLCGCFVHALQSTTPSVPPKYLEGPVIIEVDCLSSSLWARAGVPRRCAGRPYVNVQDLGSATLGELGLTAATNGFAALSSQTVEANTGRPNLLGVATARVG